MILLNKIFEDACVPIDCGASQCLQTPKPHQLEDLGKILPWKRSANFSEVGTGKSLVSFLYIAHKLYSGKKVLVVMPPPLIHQYITEFNRIVTDMPFKMVNVSIPKGKRDNMLDHWDAGHLPDVAFMSYQMFARLARYLFGLRHFNVLVCDEAHALKGASTNNFAVAYRAVFNLDFDFHEMTATPITADLLDAYAHIKLRQPKKYPNLEYFKRQFIVYADNQFLPFDKIVDYQSREPLMMDMNEFAVRRRQRDVLSLEEPTIIEQRVLLEPEHYVLYKKLLTERILQLGDQVFVADNMSALRQYALQIITNMEHFTDKVIDDAPIASLKAILESINTRERKVLIFCVYRSTVRKLAKLFDNPALIYGDSNCREEVIKFQTDVTCRAAIANYKSGGAGFNLQHVCSDVIFFEPEGTPSSFEQGLGRVQREGQVNPVKAWLFRFERTWMDRLVDSALGRSKETSYIMQDKKVLLESLYL